MKKNYIIICLICLLLCSCNSNESKKQAITNNSTYNAEKQEQETQKEVFDALGKSDAQWGGEEVENSKFVFSVSKNKLIQKDKSTSEKTILKRWKGEKNISLCCKADTGCSAGAYICAAGGGLFDCHSAVQQLFGDGQYGYFPAYYRQKRRQQPAVFYQ